MIIEFLENISKQPINKLFGCWKWEVNFTEKHKELFKPIQTIFKTRLTEYYNNGAIRFAIGNYKAINIRAIFEPYSYTLKPNDL